MERPSRGGHPAAAIRLAAARTHAGGMEGRQDVGMLQRGSSKDARTHKACLVRFALAPHLLCQCSAACVRVFMACLHDGPPSQPPCMGITHLTPASSASSVAF